jgi:uncharacterized membrane protein
MEYLLLGLLGLAIPVAWTAAFFMALGARARLASLEHRFVALERRLALGIPPAAAAAPASGPATDDAAALGAVAKQWEPPPAPTPPGASPPAQFASPQPASVQASAEEAAAVPPSEPPPPDLALPSPPSPPPPPSVEPSFEERIGTRWVVWVGGIALALGAVFLVKYSIEQGLIGPGMRIFLGALFATALIATGEWSRRNEALAGLPALPQASIPAILTAAGTVAAYATVWAAHGLYEFIGPALAFPLLGAVALATLAAALLHGPALAGLGVVGAYVTPLLISSEEPNFWALYLFLIVVTGAAFALARIRLWRWLAFTAVAASTLWIVPGLADAVIQGAAPHAFYLAAAFALAAALIVTGLLFGPDAEADAVDEVSSLALAAYLAAATLLVLATDHAPVALWMFTALVVATVAIAWRASSALGALPAAALLAAVVIGEWAVQLRLETLLAPGGPVAADVSAPGRAFVGMHLALGAAFAALFGVTGFLAQGRNTRPVNSILWAACAVAAPVAILIALYYRVAGFERSIPFAGIALVLAALYATATEVLSKQEQRPGMASGAALFAVGAIASLALTLTFALEKGWLTVALALMAPGIAMIADKRPLPLLRWMAAGCAALVCARILWEPRIVSDVGTTPIFNWLLWGYGVPALSFWSAGALLRRRADDVPSRILDSAAILFTVLTASLQIRHYLNNGDIYYPTARLAEIGMHVCVFLAMAIGLERLRGRTENIVHNIAAVLVAGLALIFIVFGLLLQHNPLFSHTPVGGPIINLILLAYGLPAGLAITLALIAKNTRDMAYRAIAAATAVILALGYLTLQVRRFYQGPDLSMMRRTGDPEMWTYSAVWLAFGVALLLVGILVRSQPARLASALVILLTVLKVFLYDLAGIGGIWRSFSFIGLGAVLIAIGWMYQRLLFPRRPPGAGVASAPEDGEPSASSSAAGTG